MAATEGFLSGQSALYSSTNSQFLNRSLYNEKRRQRRVVQYEKEFNINITRINADERELRDSMLAYSKHMKRIKDRSQMVADDVCSLQIRARNIPKARTLPKFTSSKHFVKDNQYSQSYTVAKDDRLPSNNSEGSQTGSSLGKPTYWPSKLNSPRKEELRMNYAFDVDIEEMKEEKSSKAGAVRVHVPTTHVQAAQKSKSKVKEQGATKTPISRAVKLIDLRPAFEQGDQLTNKSSIESIASTTDKSSIESIASTNDSKREADDGEFQRKREEAAKRILQNAISKLREVENSSRDPRQLIARLKNNRLKNKRLKFTRQILDVIPEDEDGSERNALRSGASNISDPVRFSLSREHPIERLQGNGGSSKTQLGQQVEQRVLTGFVPDTSMFPKRTFALPPLASKPVPYQEYGQRTSTKKLQQRARQRQRERKLKFLRD